MSSRSFHSETTSDSSRDLYTGASQGYLRPAYLEVKLKVARNGSVQACCSPEVLDNPRLASLVRELGKLMRAHHLDIEAIHRPSRVTVAERASHREYERRTRQRVPHLSGTEEKVSSSSSQQSDSQQKSITRAVHALERANQALAMKQRNCNRAERDRKASYMIFHSQYWRPLISDQPQNVIKALKSIHRESASLNLST